MKNLLKFAVVAMLGLGIASGCATTKSMTATTPIQEIKGPEWVVKGSGAFGGSKGKVFYGVGSSYGIRNPSLARETADDRARSALSKEINIYTASLSKDYMASTMAGNPNVTAEEQHVERVVKVVTAMSLSGVEIVDHWQHPATGELFALARLDFGGLQEGISKAQELDEQTKEYIRKNAERLFEQMEVREKSLRSGK